jgi:hypothetical protein
MASLLTYQFSTLLAESIYNLLDVSSNAYLPLNRRSYLFAILGKETPWNAGTEVAPTPGQSIRNLNSYYDRGIVAKRISQENASFVVPRVNWSSNTLFTFASCGVCPAGTPFYVLNSKDQVFKCLWNNGGTNSNTEPQLSLSSTSLEEPYFETPDGYKWKYLYTLTSLQKQKFLTEEYMPVVYNRFVRTAAVNRSIDIVRITNAGNNYVDGSSQDIITITGDGTDAILKANVSGGQVIDIIVQNRGEGYTKANLTFTDVAGGVGSGATAEVVLSPQNGHGYDPVEELYANTILFNVDFDGSEDGVFPADNEYREITLLKNPYEYDTTELAGDELYTLYTKIKVSPGVGDFNNDELVFQGVTLETSTFSADVISFDESQNLLYLNNINGTLATNEPIKGHTSGAIRVAINKTNPSLELYSGKILYVSDKTPITRDPDQIDRIRFILKF